MARGHNSAQRAALAERRAKVARRYIHGDLQAEIARAFEVSQQTISHDLRVIHDEWLKQSVQDRAEWVANELARIDEVERQAWIGWRKSQEDAQTLKARMQDGGHTTEKISKGQAGDVRFLGVVLNCITKRCELRHLGQALPGQDQDTPDRVVVYVPDNARDQAPAPSGNGAA